MSPQRVVRYAVRHQWRTLLFVVGIVIVAAVLWWVQDTASTAKDAATDARHAVVQVQQERARATREACEAVNARNRVALRFLRALPPSPGERQMTPAERDRLLRGFTDALVGPVRDCDAVVRRLVPSHI